MRWIGILCLVQVGFQSEARGDELARLERQARAAFVPRVTLGIRSVAISVPGLVGRSVEVFAWLRWPLERRLASGPLTDRRESFADEAAARRKARLAMRPKATSLRGEIDDLLDEEEAQVLP